MMRMRRGRIRVWIKNGEEVIKNEIPRMGEREMHIKTITMVKDCPMDKTKIRMIKNRENGESKSDTCLRGIKKVH